MQVFNDLSRKKEELLPLTEGEFKIYVCGPTVYDYFHLGNARPFIVYDTLRRYLLYRGYKVRYVQNFTDIDDKMIHRAHADGCTVTELADQMIAEYFKDADGLGIMRADAYPRATECIADIVELIECLIAKGHAYVLSDGVYFAVSSFPDYGKLSHHNLADLEEGASQRVDQRDEKRSPMDFVLWKFKKEGEPSWASPWGEGRPGWHIECSAMNKKYLGDTVDIHGGGQDLIFPHHENEIAQSEAANGKTFVRYWMHNGFVNVDNEKMAKSTGNFFRVRDLSTKYPYEVLRFFMLQAHYRMPINFANDLLEAAGKGWERVKECAASLEFRLQTATEARTTQDTEVDKILQDTRAAFISGMDDDLNTAEAFAAIFECVRALNSLLAQHCPSQTALQAALNLLRELCQVMGLTVAPEQQEVPPAVLLLAQQRQEAKEQKNFALADSLRAEIKVLGWNIADTPQGARFTPEEI